LVKNVEVSIDKGCGMLRTAYISTPQHSVVQLENQTQTVSIKQLSDIQEFMKVKLSPTFFLALFKESGSSYRISF